MAYHHYDGLPPSENMGMTLTIRNRGTKPTSIESLALTVDERTEGKMVGRLVHTKPYVLPKTIEPDTTTVQEALFRLDEMIHDDSDCVLTLKTIHKELKVRCRTLPLAPPEQ